MCIMGVLVHDEELRNVVVNVHVDVDGADGV
jgi:hypothetical protein